MINRVVNAVGRNIIVRNINFEISRDVYDTDYQGMRHSTYSGTQRMSATVELDFLDCNPTDVDNLQNRFDIACNKCIHMSLLDYLPDDTLLGMIGEKEVLVYDNGGLCELKDYLKEKKSSFYEKYRLLLEGE